MRLVKLNRWMGMQPALVGIEHCLPADLQCHQPGAGLSTSAPPGSRAQSTPVALQHCLLRSLHSLQTMPIMDPATTAALAVTTAGVMLAIASIHGSVSCSLEDILEGRAASYASRDTFFIVDDDEADDTAFLAARMEMEDAAAVVAALFEEEHLTNVQLFGANVNEWYVKPRSLTWFENFVQSVYDDERWKRLFRVGRGTFMYLEESLRAHLIRSPPDSLARALPTRFISVTKQIAVGLYKLGHGGSNFGVGELFGIGDSTVSDVVWRVAKAVVIVEGPSRLRWPEEGEERAAAIAQMEAVHGIPNCVGAIDCTHILHEAPAGFLTTDYFDRDHNFSTMVQLVTNVSASLPCISESVRACKSIQIVILWSRT